MKNKQLSILLDSTRILVKRWRLPGFGLMGRCQCANDLEKELKNLEEAIDFAYQKGYEDGYVDSVFNALRDRTKVL